MIPSLTRLFDTLGRPFAAFGAARRSYDAAGGGRRWRGFNDMPNQLAAQLAARGPVGKRARALVANNPLAASGAEAWVSALVGTGIKPQSTHPDEAVRTALNASFERWTDAADAEGRSDFYGLQELIMRRTVIDGEAFIAFTYDARCALRLRLIDAEQVDASMHRELANGVRIIAGIEFDAAGRRLAYHVFRERPGLPLGTSFDTVRLPAEDVCHIFRMDVPGQVRGLSWFAPVLLRLADYDAAADAQLVRQKVAALLTGFIIDPNAEPAGFGGQPDSAGNLEGGMEPGALKVLHPGQDIRFSDPASVGPEVIEFLKVTAREIAAGLGVPYETLTGDLSGTNYSSIRAGLVAFRRRVEALQYNVLVYQLCRPVWHRFVTAEVLSGRLPATGFERDPELYLAARWITPRQEWVDPAKDSQAEIAAIGAGLMSRRQAVAARGYDLEALDAEIAADNARAAALGLTFAAGAKAPAAAESDGPANAKDQTETEGAGA
ncbi:phage portal protein [Xanthobacter versatilis]|uniref:phage portal protein n=1 Tax=Xanthobacter autotrophicus (strain ATCC BAA-1158 / Py2) TaxID=78245 RepID=UPI00372CBC00